MLKSILSALGLVSKREHKEALRIVEWQKTEIQAKYNTEIIRACCEPGEVGRKDALVRELRLNLQARDAELQTLRAVAGRRLETMTQQSERIERLTSTVSSIRLELAKVSGEFIGAGENLRKAELQLGVSRERREEIGRQLDDLREVSNGVMNFLLANSADPSEAREFADLLAEELNT